MKKWYVVKTKGNKENFAKQNLINQNFEVYYPVTKRLKKVANKLKVVEQSLFPGYLFVKFDLNTYDWSKINNTRGVSSLIKLSQNLMHIPEVDIHNLKLGMLQNCCVLPVADVWLMYS